MLIQQPVPFFTMSSRLNQATFLLQDFAESMIEAVEKATSRRVDRRVQVIQRPSKEGKYTAVSVRSVNIESGKQVLSVFREMKESGGKRLKYII